MVEAAMVDWELLSSGGMNAERIWKCASSWAQELLRIFFTYLIKQEK